MSHGSFLDRLAESSEIGVAAKTAIGTGATSAIIFGINAQVVGIVAGIIIGLLGLAYTIWSTERKLKIFKEHLGKDFDE